jgi:pimeloyl-ACP methyl ester carboxylesterase
MRRRSSSTARPARTGASATERIRDALPDARIALLPGEGHAAIMTAPELVADEVIRFLARDR